MYTLVVHNVAFKLLFVGQGREKKTQITRPLAFLNLFNHQFFFFANQRNIMPSAPAEQFDGYT